MISIKRIPPIVGIILGVTFYEIANTFQYIIQPVFFPSFFRLIGFLIIIYYLFRATIMPLPRGVSGIFNLLIVWTIIMALRGSLIGNYAPGADTSFKGILHDAFLSPYGPSAFFIPFLALVSFSHNSLFYLKKIAVFLCVLALFLSFMWRGEIVGGIMSSGMTTMANPGDTEITVRHLIYAFYPGFGLILFFLFLFNYIKGKVAYLFPIAIFVYFISNAIGGGRGQTGLNLVYLLFFFFLAIKYPLNNKTKKIKRFSYVLLAVSFVFLIYYLYNNTSVFDYVLQRAFGEKTIGGEFINDSRNLLRDDMVRDFNEHPLDWVWGRGVNGAYRTSHYSIGGFRIWMEWGYLYLIIKGGVVYLFLYVFCMLHAAYMGFFRSNNVFSKCLAMMCVVYLLNLVSAGSEPQFSTLFLLSWVSFGLIARPQIRMMDDEIIYGYFNKKTIITNEYSLYI